MAGLFDFLRDNPAITQGLLAGGFGAMAGRGSKLQAWGQGGLAGLQGYGNALNAQAQEQDRALAAKRAAIQEQMLQMQLENAQRQQQGQKATQDYLTQALSPVQPIDANAVSGVMGPRPDALKPVGTTPGFNVGSALKAGVPVDALGQIQQMLQKQQPKLETIAPGAKIGYYAPDGTFKEVASNPKEEDIGALIIRGPDGKPMINRMAFDVKRALAAAGASNTNVSYGTPVQGIDKNGSPVWLQPTKDGSPPKIIEGVRPPMSGAEEKASAEKATRDRQGKQMLSVLTDAENILKEGNATGSGAGMVADAALRGIGVSTKGSIDASRLESLSGWLVANVPRMEGPQSNFDVENYKTMAGKVGNSGVPIKERLAALKEVRNLQKKYAAINGTPDQEQPSGDIDSLVNKYRSK